MRVSVPAPVLVAAAVVILAIVILLRPQGPVTATSMPGIVTRLNATGFQPLPNGEARVVKVNEVQQ